MSTQYKAEEFDPDSRMFSDLLPYVLPSVPTCSNMLAVQNIRRAAIDLCQKSRIWRITQHPLPVGNDGCEYEFEPLMGADRVRIEWITYDGQQLEATTEHQLRKCHSDWTRQRGKPTKYLEMNTNSFRLWPAPEGWFSANDAYMPPDSDSDPIDTDTERCSVLARISMRPRIDSSSMDSLVLEDHYSAIVNGALAYLFMTPNHPWTDFALGQQYEQAFLMGIEAATTQAVDGNVSVVRTTRYGGL